MLNKPILLPLAIPWNAARKDKNIKGGLIIGLNRGSQFRNHPVKSKILEECLGEPIKNVTQITNY
jgi:hypothetical protein